MQTLLVFAVLMAGAPAAQADDATPAILWALQLPALVSEARRTGVTDAVIRDVLDGLRRRGLPADQAALVIREEIDAVKAGGLKDNFGGFVHRQLDAGLRGRALADAIRAEHRARGIGRAGTGTPQRRDPRGPGGTRP